MPRLAVVFHHLGPYHVARLAAAGERGPVCAVELSAETDTYLWDRVGDNPAFERITVFRDRNSRTVKEVDLTTRVWKSLSEAQPDVVAICGWWETGCLAALRWCRRARVPATVMSESQRLDAPRVWWKESIKRQVISCFAAGLVGGQPHREYLISLGMPADRVFTGYDVVDNAYFARGADAARENPAAERARRSLPERYFLASNRFIPKKNLQVLLLAYARYRQVAGTGTWKLVLLGDGPMREQVLAMRKELGLDEAVLLPGFRQYGDLPAFYGLAGAFVHASTSEQWGLVVNEAMAAGLPVFVSDRCGCAVDLVSQGRNGHTFDPDDVEGLAGHLLKAAGGVYDLAAMGKGSREIISQWSPETFGAGIWQAANVALEGPRLRRTLLKEVLLKTLSRRRA